jgi:hypothetical protein
LFLKLPILFANFGMRRRTHWADEPSVPATA